MNNLQLRRLPALVIFATAAVAHAHPGHAGHDLTWELSGSSTHGALTVVLYVALVGAGIWAARQVQWRQIFSRRAAVERNRPRVTI